MNKIFVVDQKKLLSILSSMQPLCSKRTSVEATSHILFCVGQKEAILKATDLEVSLQSSCEIEESTFGEGEQFLVSGKRLFDITKELDGAIFCRLEGGVLALESGGVHLTLNVKPAEEFPPFPERIENLMSLSARDVLSMIERVAFLVPHNNSNPGLNGLYLEISQSTLKMTATDGHCLAQVTSPHYTLDEPKSWLLPRRAIFELKKLIESNEDEHIFLGVCENHFVISGELFNFFTRLLSSTFPEYQQILNKDGFAPARVERSRLVKTLRRTTCLLSGQFLATHFTFEDDTMHVAFDNKEVGSLEEDVPLEGSSHDMEIRFYSPYLLSGLQQAFDVETLEFYLKNPASPIMFESHQERFATTYLVMPVSQ